jgi:dipeptidyl aminopeptidase/acylaminoacyl peptidase
VFEPRLSSDGGAVMYGEVALDAVGQRVVSLLLHVIGVAGSVRLTPEPAMRPARGMGGGSWCFALGETVVVYVATDGNLWLQPIDGGPTRQLTFLTNGRSAMCPSCHGDNVAFVVDLEEVRVVNVRTGAERRVDDASHDGLHDFVIDPTFTPDGKVAWVAWDVPNMHWDHSTIVVEGDGDLTLGDAIATAHSVQQLQWAPDGRKFAICDHNGWAQVCREGRPVVEEQFEHAGPVWGPGARNYSVSPDGAHVAFTRNEHGFGRLCIASLATSEVTELGRAVHGQVSWRGDHVVALRSGARTPTQLVAYHVATGARTVIDAGSTVEWDVELLAEPELLTIPSTDVEGVGDVVHARLYRAPVAEPGTPTRTIVWLHGGPTDQWQVTFMPRLVYWMSRGWNIVVPDHRGSTGHGREYTQALRGQWGVLDVADTVAVARWVVQHGIAAPNSMVVMGGSAGGFTALSAVAAAPGLFAAAAVAYPVTNLADLPVNSHRFEQHYTDLLVGPWPQAGDVYRSRSPLSWPERFVGTPLLVLHGDADPVVSVQQSIAFVDGVRNAGGDAQLHIYAGEGHGFRNPVNQLDEYRRLTDFLAAHCR